MTIISEVEQRVWTYLLQNPLATAKDLHIECEVPIELAQNCIDRIATPREVFEQEALRRGLREDEMNQRQETVWPDEGRKDDGGKARMELIPPELLFAVATILTFGAIKYEARNWEKGMGWGRVFGACMRHMWAWWGGKGPTTKNFLFGELDTETGYSHLWHAACCIAFLVAFEERGKGTDDRTNT